jgi:hypothetical protein
MQEDCDICLVEHDEEIHGATLRVREWHRELVTRYLPVDEERVQPTAA